MRTIFALFLVLSVVGPLQRRSMAQPYGLPDRGAPGDEMIQAYLRRETAKIHATFLKDLSSVENWEKQRARYKKEYDYMLGLPSREKKTPLKATVTGTRQGDGFVVEMLHYQSRPRLYVTANLYRPSKISKEKRLPAVLYVCGHSSRGRNGSKTAYQSHGIWFARHGYVCLIVDTLQLGEIAAIHHGTYREERWWWHSRGYTSAGVECWNGVRGIDYLISRPDVDAGRIAVTGISGGGAATFWVVAADERVRVAVPVSGMADLTSYVSNRVINGHCDCMFLHNAFRWPWTRIAAMVAPRPLLFVNSDTDRIFPMDANERVINRLERLYSLYGAGDFVDSQVSVGGHAYRRDIRKAAYRFINIHLKNDPRVIADSEVDLVAGPRKDRRHPIPPEKLRVFPTDKDIPRDELNTTIDQHFVPLAKPSTPQKGQGEFEAWKRKLQSELRRVAFGYFPKRIPIAKLKKTDKAGELLLETEPGIRVRLETVSTFKPTLVTKRVLLFVRNAEDKVPVPKWLHRVHQVGDIVYALEPRGVGASRWTRKNPPNYIERSHVLLGRTVDTGRVWDVVASARYLRSKSKSGTPVFVLGHRAAGVIAAYAALAEDDIAGVIAQQPLLTHMDSEAPQFLNVLRVCDVPQALGMLAPRRLSIVGSQDKRLEKVRAIYAAAGASTNLKFVHEAPRPKEPRQ